MFNTCKMFLLKVCRNLLRIKPSFGFYSFLIIYAAFTLVVYNYTFWSKNIAAVKFNKITDFTFFLSYIFVLFAIHLIAFLVFFNKFTTKTIAIFLLIANSFASYFITVYGVMIDHSMITNVLQTDINEATDLLNVKLMLYITVFGVLPSVMVLRTKIIYKTVLKEILYRVIIILVLLVVSLVLVFCQYRQIATFVRSTNDNFNYLVPRSYLNAFFKVTKKHFEKEEVLVRIANDLKVDSKKETLVVLIVGETARKANFSLYGYQQETNPLLKKDDIFVLKNVTSCGTSTAVSLPCMFSHLGREQFVSNNTNYEFIPSLLARNGVNVLYKDNNFGGCKGTCNEVETVDIGGIGNDKEFCFGGDCVDGILLEGVEEYIKSKNGNTLVVLHQNGSHGPKYNKRYPKSFEKFTPVCDNSDLSQCSKEELVNAYNNTILYTDYIVHTVIEMVKKTKKNAVVIYVSDHGESLGENNLYLHGFPYKFAPDEQKEIPFIVWFSDSFKKERSITEKCLNAKDSYSHDNLFHSLLGVFNAKTEIYDKSLDIVNQCL